MPRYFFNVVSESRFEDPAGLELGDLAAARREALKDMADIKRQRFELLDVEKLSTWCIEICDEQGAVLLVVPFSSN